MLKALPALALCALLLGGCGTYRPLYGTAANGTSVATSLSQLMVQEQHTRAGQLIRNELLDGAGTGRQRYEHQPVAPKPGSPAGGRCAVAPGEMGMHGSVLGLACQRHAPILVRRPRVQDQLVPDFRFG